MSGARAEMLGLNPGVTAGVKAWLVVPSGILRCLVLAETSSGTLIVTHPETFAGLRITSEVAACHVWSRRKDARLAYSRRVAEDAGSVAP